MFQKEAEHWWRAVKHSVKNTRESITWEFLVNKFTEKYIPETARDKMVSEFLELCQGLMNVSQYDQRFTQLSRYADALVKSEAERNEEVREGPENRDSRQIDSFATEELSPSCGKSFGGRNEYARRSGRLGENDSQL